MEKMKKTGDDLSLICYIEDYNDENKVRKSIIKSITVPKDEKHQNNMCLFTNYISFKDDKITLENLTQVDDNNRCKIGLDSYGFEMIIRKFQDKLSYRDYKKLLDGVVLINLLKEYDDIIKEEKEKYGRILSPIEQIENLSNDDEYIVTMKDGSKTVMNSTDAIIKKTIEYMSTRPTLLEKQYNSGNFNAFLNMYLRRLEKETKGYIYTKKKQLINNK